jgi:hypothetical protein
MGWATFWAIFSRTHLVALLFTLFSRSCLSTETARLMNELGSMLRFCKMLLQKQLAKKWKFAKMQK